MWIALFNLFLKEYIIDFSFLHVDNRVHLIIQDNGSGFNETNTHKGYGLKMLNQISKKLKNSKVAFTQERGSKFELTFELI